VGILIFIVTYVMQLLGTGQTVLYEDHVLLSVAILRAQQEFP
jgi:hypothetical protein